MLITITNWGPIKKVEYDLDKQLHITYGNNSIGKSYSMQLVYIILREFLSEPRAFEEYIVKNTNQDIGGDYNGLQEFVGELFKNNNDETDITANIERCIGNLLTNSVFIRINDSLKNTFGNYDSLKKDKPFVQIQIANTKLEIDFDAEKVHYRGIEKRINLIKKTSTFHKSRDLKQEYQIYWFSTQNDGKEIKSAIELIISKIYEHYFSIFHKFQEQVGNVYYLPASRSGITIGMNSVGPMIAQLSQQRNQVTGGFNIATIPVPISDYYIQLISISANSTSKYKGIAEQIEKDILHGTVGFDSQAKVLKYTGDCGYELDMNDSSSMISEISPIVAFFKYIVGNTSQHYSRSSSAVIFIEEPEAHLHPSNQIKLIEKFVEATSEGVKLVLSSHSNYIFNKMNNMVLDRKVKMDNYTPLYMFEENGRTFSKVMLMDELGVSDVNFSDTSQKLMDEREEIVNRIMEQLN